MQTDRKSLHMCVYVYKWMYRISVTAVIPLPLPHLPRLPTPPFTSHPPFYSASFLAHLHHHLFPSCALLVELIFFYFLSSPEVLHPLHPSLSPLTLLAVPFFWQGNQVSVMAHLILMLLV